MKFSNLLFAFFLLISNFAIAQITGKIEDTTDDYPLEYATAALYSQKDKSLVSGGITDVNGVFRIENVKNGRYYLETSFVGYITRIIQNIDISRSNKRVD